jgi:hypothetical protein
LVITVPGGVAAPAMLETSITSTASHCVAQFLQLRSARPPHAIRANMPLSAPFLYAFVIN